MSKGLEKKLFEALEGKKQWIWLLTYLVFTGILFGIFRLILFLLGIVPWIGVLVLVACGLIWGSIEYSRNRSEKELEDIETEETSEE